MILLLVVVSVVVVLLKTLTFGAGADSRPFQMWLRHAFVDVIVDFLLHASADWVRYSLKAFHALLHLSCWFHAN